MQLSKLRSLTLATLLVTLTISLSACGSSNSDIKNHNTGTSSIIKLLKTSTGPITPKIYPSTNDPISSDYFNYPEEKCYTQSNPSLCLTSLLENTVTTKGAIIALTQLKTFSSKFSPFCNNVSIGIGKFVALKKSAPIEITNQDPSICGDAFSQGYFDYAISNSQTEDKTLSKICDILDRNARWTCSNHLGAYFMNTNIKDPVASAYKCYFIPSPDDSKGNHMTFRRACLSGAWHEFFTNTGVLDFLKTSQVKSGDIFSFCLASERSSKEVCLQEDSNPFWVLPQFNSIDEKFKSCRDLAERDLTDQCYFGMSRGVADSAQRSIPKTYSSCLSLSNFNDREYCYIAAGEAMDRNDFASTAEQNCQNYKNSDFCNFNLGMMAYGLFSGDHKLAIAFCEKMIAPAQSNCREGVFAGLNRISFVHAQPTKYNEIFAKCSVENSTNKSLCEISATHGIGDILDKMQGTNGLQSYCATLTDPTT